MLSARSTKLIHGLQRPTVLGVLSPNLRPPRPSQRSFSLWPSAPSPPPIAPSEPTQLAPPSLTDLTAPLHLPTATFFEPASTLLLSIPSALPVPLSFAALIPIITLLVRGSTTLPLTRWQRARTRRYEEKVMPEVRKQQEKVRWEVRDKCRRDGKSFEEYQKAYATAAKKAATAVARKHKAHPLLTLLLPPLLHIPIFIGTTLILRDACARAVASLPLTTSSLSAIPTASSVDSSYSDAILNPTILSSLHDLAATPLFSWCPSLVLPDPTMALPLAVGLAALANVEVSAKTRRANAAAALSARGELAPSVEVGSATGSRGIGMRAGEQERALQGSLSAAEKGRIRARRARDLANSPRPYSTPSSVVQAPVQRKQEDADALKVVREKEAEMAAAREAQLEPRAARIMTNALRFSAVLFIPVASFAPSAVCLYWLTSNLFTLIQSSIFAAVDRKRERERRLRAIIG